MTLQGRIIAAHGRHYLVDTGDGEPLPCVTRGKKSDVACGDWVEIMRTSDDQGVIENILPRRQLLYRSNETRQKLIAANVDQVVIVVACAPAFSDDLITRAIIAAESEEIEVHLVLNKCDLTETLPRARKQLAVFADLGYPVLELSARSSADLLRPRLQGKTSVLVGQSGMGKSTLINALIPDAGAATREISKALDSGKHTTTHATLYRLDAHSRLIDSPGLQEFGLHHLSPEAIEQGFPELRPFVGQCRFRNCQHDREPGCAVHAALQQGLIDPRRHAVFRQLQAEVGTPRW